MLKEANLIKSNNPETYVVNTESICTIAFNTISQLNVNMARILNQMHFTFDIDFGEGVEVDVSHSS